MTSDQARKLKGKRFLVWTKPTDELKVIERTIIEISPTGNYVLLVDRDANKTWCTTESVTFAEVLD